jgi:hypothetical protein
MPTEPDRYHRIAEECRVLAEDAKSRNWIEVYTFLKERASLNEQMAEAMTRSAARLRSRSDDKYVIPSGGRSQR